MPLVSNRQLRGGTGKITQRIGPIDRARPTPPRGRGQRRVEAPIGGLPMADPIRQRNPNSCRLPIYARAAFLVQMIGARLGRSRVDRAREHCASVHDAYRRAAGPASSIGLRLARTV